MSSVNLRIKILNNKHNLNEFILNLSTNELFKDNEDVLMCILKGVFDADGFVLKDFIIKFKNYLTFDLLESAILENIWENGLISKRINNIKDIIQYSDESFVFDKYMFNTNNKLTNKIFNEEIIDLFPNKITKPQFNVKKLENLAKDWAISKQYTSAINSLDKMVFRKCRSYILSHNELLNSIETIDEFEKFKEINSGLVKIINSEKKLRIDYLKKEDVFLMLLTSDSKNEVKKIVSNWFLNDEELRKYFIDNLRELTKANKELIQICINDYKSELPKLNVPTSKLDDYFIKFLNAKYYVDLHEFLELANFTKNIYIEKQLFDLNRIKKINEHYSDEYIKEKIIEKSNYFTNQIFFHLSTNDELKEEEKHLLKNELKKKNYLDLINFNSCLKSFDFENIFTIIKMLDDKEILNVFKKRILDEISNIIKSNKNVGTFVGNNISKIVGKYTEFCNDVSIINNEYLKNIYLDEYQKYNKTYFGKIPIYFMLPDYMGNSMINYISLKNWKDVLLKNKNPNFFNDILLKDKNFPFIIKMIKDVILLDDNLKKSYLKKSNIKSLKNHNVELDDLLNKIQVFLELKETLVLKKNEVKVKKI